MSSALPTVKQWTCGKFAHSLVSPAFCKVNAWGPTQVYHLGQCHPAHADLVECYQGHPHPLLCDILLYIWKEKVNKIIMKRPHSPKNYIIDSIFGTSIVWGTHSLVLCVLSLFVLTKNLTFNRCLTQKVIIAFSRIKKKRYSPMLVRITPSMADQMHLLGYCNGFYFAE